MEETLDLQPVPEETLDLQPVEETLDLQPFVETPSLRPAIPPPGEQAPLVNGSVSPSPTQAFPLPEKLDLAPLTLEEAEQILTTPQVSIPRFGEEGTVTRAVSELGSGLIEQSALTPVAPIINTTLAIPGVRAVVGTVMAAGAAKASAEKAGEATVTGNPQTITEAVGLGAMALLGAVGVGKDIAQSKPLTAAKETLRSMEQKPEALAVLEEAAPLTAAVVREGGEPVGTVRTSEPETPPAPKPVESPVEAPPPGPNPFSPEALTTPASETLGIRPSADPLKALDSLKSSAKKWFTTAGHLPEEVHALKGELEAAQAKADFSIRMRERDLMEALGETYGIGALSKAGGGSRRIPVSAVQLMDDYLKGRVANPTVIPPEIRGVLDTMRAEIDAGSTKVLDSLNRQLGAIKPGSPSATALEGLIEKIKNNLDVYVHRSYKFFDSEKPAPEWYADVPGAARARAEDYLINNSPAPLTRPEAQSLLLDWLSDLKDASSQGSATLGSKDLSIFMRRKVIAPEFREVLGEYRNPLINYAKSVAKMSDWVAKQKFLEEVKRKGMGSFLFEEGANPPGFNTQIAGDASKVLSPLNGLRTSQEIAEAFKGLDAVTDHGVIARSYLTLNAFSKFSATGLSWMTQARNLLSRPFMSGMAGHWQAGKLGKSARAIYEDFAGSDPAWRSYLGRAYELGVIGDSARSGELRAIIKDASLRDVAPSELYSWSIGRAIKHYGYKVPAEVYRLSDELGNIFGWENEKAIQAKVHPTWSAKEIEVEAAKIVRQIYPIYSETPAAVKSFRKVALVGPFVTFPYQMFRTTWNAIGRSFHEIRSANPVEREIGYKRLASQMAVVTATYALQEVGKAFLGVSTKQEDDFRRFQPSWSKNSKYLFVGKGDGELSAINLSYLDPYSYLTDPLVAIASSARSEKSLFDTFADTTKEIFSPWVSEQMLAKALIEARNGKTDSGREIFNETDPPVDAFQKQVAHVVKALEPGTMQRLEKRILPAIKNEQPIYGRKLEVGPEIARELTGLAVEKFSFKNGLAFRAKDFIEKDRAAESVFHQTVSRTETTTPGDLLTAFKEADSRRFEVWKELRKDFLAAVRQGVPVNDARRTMIARGMTKGDVQRISNGRYEPMRISDQTVKRAKERSRALPFPEIQSYRREASKRSLD
jgi:hypothetical protein